MEALDELEAAVREACGGAREWQAQVAAGVRAALEFIGDSPSTHRLYLFEHPDKVRSQSQRFLLVVRLAELLRQAVPPGSGSIHLGDEALVGGIVGFVARHLRFGRPDRLPSLGPDVVLLTLLPYAGFEEACHWADRANRLDAEVS